MVSGSEGVQVYVMALLHRNINALTGRRWRERIDVAES